MEDILETGRRPIELIEGEAASRWTEERLAELRRLWVEETLSSSEIAQRMGISRSTVMGKINRLGCCAIVGRLPFRHSRPMQRRCKSRRHLRPHPQLLSKGCAGPAQRPAPDHLRAPRPALPLSSRGLQRSGCVLLRQARRAPQALLP
jgi:hypothetical protein